MKVLLKRQSNTLDKDKENDRQRTWVQDGVFKMA